MFDCVGVLGWVERHKKESTVQNASGSTLSPIDLECVSVAHHRKLCACVCVCIIQNNVSPGALNQTKPTCSMHLHALGMFDDDDTRELSFGAERSQRTYPNP